MHGKYKIGAPALTIADMNLKFEIEFIYGVSLLDLELQVPKINITGMVQKCIEKLPEHVVS